MKYLSLLLALLLLSACQTAPNIQQIEDENRALTAELDQAKHQIETLRVNESQLQAEVVELKRVMSVMDTEKTVRVRESSELRGQVRRFAQQNIDALRDFLVQSDLLDYVGGELVQRDNVDSESLLVVDLANPIPADGTLTGASAHFITPGHFTVQVLRPVDDQWVVIWQSEALQAPRAGVTRVNFPVSVGVQQGDYVGYFFHAGGLVSYSRGTGDTRYQQAPVRLGETVSTRRLKGEEEKRAYSVGVYGLLN